MRVVPWLLPFLVACGDAPAPDEPEAAPTEAWPVDGFLRLLPENASIVVRAPGAHGDGEAVRRALAILGHAEGDVLRAGLDGLDPERAAGFSIGTDGSWLHFLPAADKGRMNAALREGAGRLAVREEGDWIVIGTGGAPAPGEPEPLRPGDAALRVVHHALLDELAQPGDRLDLGVALFGGGLEAKGRLAPGNGSPTAEAVERAAGPIEGLLDLLPAALAVRVESTLPPTAYATYLARRLARHASLPDGELRDNIERFLREATTGIDPAGGLAFGLDLNKPGMPGFVAVGRIAKGPPSPILAKLRREARSSFGGLVLDSRETKSRDQIAFYAWIPQSVPTDAGLPRTLVPVLSALVQEDEGVHVAFAEAEGYAVVAAGARADTLVSAVRGRILRGATESSGARHLAILRGRSDRECILAAVVAGSQFGGLAGSDAGRLRSLLGAGGGSRAPDLIAIAGFRDGKGLGIEARVLYD